MSKEKKDIGIDVKIPAQRCDDKKCPFHSNLSVRGQIIEGTVVRNKMQRTVVVERERLWYLPKYERYEKRVSRYFAHNPSCINAKVGDIVKIAECRPLSKHVTFTVIEVQPLKR